MADHTALRDLFLRQAGRTPEAPAVICSGERLTYRALHERAVRIAARLRELGAGPEALVGIFLHRSADMVATLLGVWHAGAAYVPLDPDYPAERLAFMAEDAGLSVMVTSRALRDRMPSTQCPVLVLEDLVAGAASPTDPPDVPDDPAGLAYVIYTSGSTGRPKGVEITRGAVRNFLESMAQEPGIAMGDTLVAVTTLSFDIAVLELLLPLTVGATTVVVDAEVAADGDRLLETLQSERATMMQATPATWRMVLEAGWTGGPGFTALCGGETLPPELAAELVQRTGAVWNMYGPTETTVWSTCYRLPGSTGTVLLGKPIRNTAVYILDKWQRPTPVGVPGEIYIAGAGVARRYRNRPDLTAERFLPDPHDPDPAARMYRTGDLGRYRNDGNIEFRGRGDTQVKIRGFRIELGEIETVLAQHATVQAAAAMIRRVGPGDARLVAYLTPHPGATLETEAIRDHLRTKLPAYMIPQHFVVMDTMPLTPNRKVDRRGLPAFNANGLRAPDTWVTPESPTEQAVADVWMTVLGLDRVSATATFFDLGGHSILATRIVAQLRRQFEVSLTLRHLFEAPTVAGLARHLDALQHARDGVQAARPAGEREEIAF